MTVTTGDIHTYCGMNFIFKDSEVTIDMRDYLKEAIDEFKIDYKKTVNSPAAAYLFEVNENETNYYDVETGLKVRKLTTLTAPNGNVVEQPVEYSDYKIVDGVKFPFNMKTKMGPMNIEFKAEKIEVNASVTAKDFEQSYPEKVY